MHVCLPVLCLCLYLPVAPSQTSSHHQRHHHHHHHHHQHHQQQQQQYNPSPPSHHVLYKQACFVGGLFALGAKHAPTPEWEQWYLETGAGVTETCHESYKKSPNGIGPEMMLFDSRNEVVLHTCAVCVHVCVFACVCVCVFACLCIHALH